MDKTLFFTVWDSGKQSVWLYEYSGTEPIMLPPLDEDPERLISALDRLFWITGEQSGSPSLWIWEASEYRAVKLVSAPLGGYLTAFTEVDGQLFFAYGDESGWLEWWVTDGTLQGTRPVKTSGASAVSLEVDLLSAEGDDVVNGSDVEADGDALAATLHFSPTLPGDSGIASLDLTDALKALLAEGKTRATLRVSLDNPGATMSVRRVVTDSEAQTGLLVDIAGQGGFLLDLFNEAGGRMATGQEVASLQLLPAGTYVGRVYQRVSSPALTVATVEIVAPNAGNFHTKTARDLLQGSDGDDILIGGHDLDRLFGQSGYDTFIASELEVFDRLVCCQPGGGDPGVCEEPLDKPEDLNLTTILDPPLDLIVDVADPVLRVALAEQLEIPVTVAYDGSQLLHEPLWASALGTLTRLELPRAGVVDLQGSEYATNLRVVNLAGNQVSDVAAVQPATRGTGPVGWARVEYLVLDHNPVSSLQPLALMRALNGLSADYTAVSDISSLSDLRQLVFLSIDGRLDVVPAPTGDQLYEGFGLLDVFGDPSGSQFPLPSSPHFGITLASLGGRLVVAHLTRTFPCCRNRFQTWARCMCWMESPAS